MSTPASHTPQRQPARIAAWIGHAIGRVAERHGAWLRSAFLVTLLVLSQIPAMAGSMPAMARVPTGCATDGVDACRCRPNASTHAAAPICPLCDPASNAASDPAPPVAAHLCCGCCAQESTPAAPDSEPARVRTSTPERVAIAPRPLPALLEAQGPCDALASCGSVDGPWLTRDGLTHARLCRWTT